MAKIIITLLLVIVCAAITHQQALDISGHPATIGLFPWYVFYQRVHPTGFSDGCGGTLISSTWVMTAANCGSPDNTTVYRVLLGAVNWQIEENVELVIDTTVFYQHPNFNDVAGAREANLGLIELPEQVIFNPRIRAINLPWEFTDRTFTGQELFYTAALNQVNENGWNHNLRFNMVRVISDQECDSLRPENNVRQDYEMCTFGTEANPLQTPCGNSPGAAIAILIDGIWTQIGSGPDTNCGAVIPTRWIRLTDYLSWITEITGITKN